MSVCLNIPNYAFVYIYFMIIWNMNFFVFWQLFYCNKSIIKFMQYKRVDHAYLTLVRNQ